MTNGNMEKSKLIEVGNTADYDKFVNILGNRRIHEKNATNVIRSISKHGVISPICVRQGKRKLEVYDGQHTFLACKRLNKSFDYALYEDVSDRAMIDMNNASKRWAMEDYLNFGVVNGVEDYVFLNSIFQREKLPLTALIIMYGGVYANSQFKSIEWVASQKERGDNIIFYLKEMQSTFNLKQCRFARFIWGFCRVYNTGLYNHRRMMEQLSKCSQLMTRQANSGDYARNIEMVYNYKKASDNRVKFL